MMTSQAGNQHPRYFVALANDGAFLITDRKARPNHTARFLPREFVSGQGGFDPATLKYPDYVHGQLWALHQSRQRADAQDRIVAEAICTIVKGLPQCET